VDSPLVSSLSRVKSLVDGDYITYFPSLTPICGSHKAAVMLSVALGWTRSWLRQHPERGGWFWKTREEWRLETGLSRREQETARKALLEAGIFEEALRGMPARMHFRIDLERLGRLLAQGSQDKASFTRWDWDDPLVRRLLGRPVALYRRFALAAGSLAGGLLLSHLMLAYRKRPVSAGEDWAWLPINTLLLGRHLNLTRHEIDGARRRLADLGFVCARYTKTLPTRRVVRVEFDRLISAIEACGARISAAEPHEDKSMAFSDRQSIDKPTNQPVANRHPEFPETCQLDFRKPPNRVAENVPTRRALSGNSPTGANPHPDGACATASRARVLLQEIKTTTPPPAPAPNAPIPVWPEADCGGGSEENLFFSGSLLQAEQREARRWLEDVRPELRQLVLDEHAGLMRGLKEVRNPLGLLYHLIRAAREGRFTPTIAYRVAEARERAIEAAMRQRQAREEARIAQAPEARRRLSAEYVAQMRARLGAGSAAGQGRRI